jgi:hypothetical protein
MSPDAGFISATPTQGECKYDSGTLMCKLGTISPNSAVSVTIIALLRENPYYRDGKTSIASAIFVRANEKDPDPANNQDDNLVRALSKQNTRPSD